MDIDQKAKLARKLTHALHQAPDNPQLFVNIVSQVTRSASLHMTDLAITFGDLTTRLAEQLRDARKDAKPTFDNLFDMASTKVPLGKNPNRVLADVLGVTTRTIEEHKKLGRVPRGWIEKIRSLPDLDETSSEFDVETKHVIEILSERGYSPQKIRDVFGRIRTSRAGLRQIEKIAHAEGGQLHVDELAQIGRELFGDRPQAERCLQIWLMTQLRVQSELPADRNPALSSKQVEKLRTRFKREKEFRQNDPVYRTVSLAAELIERPIRANSRSAAGDMTADPINLRSFLSRLFGEGAEERHNRYLAQLTGLDDRHTLDLLKGANRVCEAWWDFLHRVEGEVLHAGNTSVLRRTA
ncbi:hypothetical protein [Microvirga arabica]|nr:hypothetical protein [Microvirga arabica]MBM1169921.1 hypothetical protein [Microvirga arabica]